MTVGALALTVVGMLAVNANKRFSGITSAKADLDGSTTTVALPAGVFTSNSALPQVSVKLVTAAGHTISTNALKTTGSVGNGVYLF